MHTWTLKHTTLLSISCTQGPYLIAGQSLPVPPLARLRWTGWLVSPARLPGHSIEAVGHYEGLCTLHILWKAPLAPHLPVPTSQLVLISFLQSPPKPFSHVSALQLPRALGCVRAGVGEQRATWSCRAFLLLGPTAKGRSGLGSGRGGGRSWKEGSGTGQMRQSPTMEVQRDWLWGLETSRSVGISWLWGGGV